MRKISISKQDIYMVWNLFKLSIGDRYLGSSLGLIWFILSPLLLMGTFTFVFTFVFPGRLPGKSDPMDYVIWLLTGYGPWLAFAEGITTSTASVTGNVGLIKNVSFKYELLPIVGALMGIPNFLVATLIVIILSLLSGNELNFTVIIIPIVLFFELVFISGLGLFLSALNVFVRDIILIMPNILTLVLFATPIFYPFSAYPKIIGVLLKYNPIYVITSCFRAPIVDGVMPSIWMIIYLIFFSSITFIAGILWFRKLKPYFDSMI